MKGYSQRGLNKFAAAYLIDDVFVERWKGKKNEIDVWDGLGTFKCRYVDRGNASFAPDSSSVSYDSTVIALMSDVMLDPSQKYRLTVREFKTQRELVDGDSETEPVVKRTRSLYVVAPEAFKDAGGNDCFMVMRCGDGDQPS